MTLMTWIVAWAVVTTAVVVLGRTPPEQTAWRRAADHQHVRVDIPYNRGNVVADLIYFDPYLGLAVRTVKQFFDALPPRADHPSL